MRKYRTPPARVHELFSILYSYNRQISIYPEIHAWMMGRQGNKTKEMYYLLTNLRINYFCYLIP